MSGALGALLNSAVAIAQPSARVARVALIDGSDPAEARGANPTDPEVRAFVHGLRELGLVDGRNIVIERRSTGGRIDGLPGLMHEVIKRGVDVIVTVGGPAVWAAHRATSRIPIVGLIDDVLDTGLLDSLARPGHNLTGFGESDAVLHGKRLQMLKEIAPSITRIAVIAYRQGPNDRGQWRRQLDASARDLNLDAQWIAVDAVEELPAALAAIVHQRAHAIYATTSHVNSANAQKIADFALKHRLPAFGFAEEGMLLSYWADYVELYRRAAGYVKKILDGAKAAELPFEQADKFELIVNLKTAKALDLPVPRSMLLSATRLIE